MFKKLVPVIALALIAGPVLAADPASTDQAPAKSSSHSSSHKHHSSKSSSKHSKSTSSTESTAPAK